jgi:hypothetical protein
MLQGVDFRDFSRDAEIAKQMISMIFDFLSYQLSAVSSQLNSDYDRAGGGLEFTDS